MQVPEEPHSIPDTEHLSSTCRETRETLVRLGHRRSRTTSRSPSPTLSESQWQQERTLLPFLLASRGMSSSPMYSKGNGADGEQGRTQGT